MRKAIFLFFVILCALPSYAGNWYVWKGATGAGTGTTWTNAWVDFNNVSFASVACGDTIWVAGNNGGTSYSGSLSGFKTCTLGTPVLIKRVLATDGQTGVSGWLSTFDSQVTISNASFTMSGNWWTLDGRVGDAQSNTPYGIVFNNTTDGWLGVIGNNSSGTITGIIVSHVEIHGPACVASGTCSGTNWALRLDAGGATGITVDHSWFHRFGEVIHGPTNASSSFTLQYSYIGEDVKVNSAEHEDLLYTANPCGAMTFNANTWYASGNDGIFMDFAGCNNGFVFTNNIMMAWGGWAIEFGKSGTCGPYVIVNNTFANNSLGSDGAGTEFSYGFINNGGCSVSAASFIENNIFYNTTLGGFTTTQSTFNAGTTANGFSWSCGTGCFSYSLASPIQNFTGFNTFTAAGSPYYSAVVQSDFHLSSSGITLFQGKGANLTSQCSTYPSLCSDKDGHLRPATAAWDLGAYQSNCGLSSTWLCLDRPGDGSNGEQEVYKQANVVVQSGGGVTITEKNTPSQSASGTYLSSDVPSGSSISCSGSGNPGTYTCTSTYTSGFIQTATFNAQYADWQINWKTGYGWPAVWLLGKNCQGTTPSGPDNVGTCNWDSPQSSEIDICEGKLVTTGSTSYLQNDFNNTVGDFVGDSTGHPVSDITLNSHTCEVVITSSSITWKIDGTTTNTKSGNYSDNYFLIMQNAIGGNNGGTPSNYSYPNASTINWVKVCTTACANGITAAAASNGNTGFNGNGFDTFSASAANAANTPTFSPVAGTYATAQNVTISTTSTGAIICYTTNGATPATNTTTGCTTGTLYSGPVNVATSETLQAVAGGTGFADSTVGSAAYTIAVPPTVITTAASNITIVAASSGGTVSFNGNASVTAEGIACGLTVNPTTACTSDGTSSPTLNSGIQTASTNWSLCFLPTCNPGGTGTPTSVTQTFGTNSLLSLSGPAFSNALYIWKNPITSSALNLSSDFVVNVSTIAAQTYEYDMFKFIGGTEYMFGSQANLSIGFWQIWDQLHGSWVTTSIPTTAFTAATNHHIQWAVHISGTNMSYDTLTFDGTVYNLNTMEPSGPTAFSDAIGIQFQMDENSSGTSLTETLSAASFSYGGLFNSNVTGLTPNALNHYRAYATNSAGTGYGADLTLTTFAFPCMLTYTIPPPAAAPFSGLTNAGTVVANPEPANWTQYGCFGLNNPIAAVSDSHTSANLCIAQGDATGCPSQANYSEFIDPGDGEDSNVSIDIRQFVTVNAGGAYHIYNLNPSTMIATPCFTSNTAAGLVVPWYSMPQYSHITLKKVYSFANSGGTSNGTVMSSYNLTGTCPLSPSATTVIDFKATNGVPSTYIYQAEPVAINVGTPSVAGDTIFAWAASNSATQNTAIYVTTWNSGSSLGFSTYETDASTVAGDYGGTGAVLCQNCPGNPIDPGHYLIHNVKLSPDGKYAIITPVAGSCTTTCFFSGSNEYIWQIGTIKLYMMVGGSSGHYVAGYTGMVNEDNTPYHDWRLYGSSSFVTFPGANTYCGNNPPAQALDSHDSWWNNKGFDLEPFLESPTTQGNVPNYTGCGVNELIGMFAPPNIAQSSTPSGNIIRWAHTYCGPVSEFQGQNCLAEITPDGQFALLTSPMVNTSTDIGQLGDTSGNFPCTVVANCRSHVFLVRLTPPPPTSVPAWSVISRNEGAKQ